MPASCPDRRSISNRSRRSSGQRGFTMVELVMVIVLTGILGSMSMMFIVEPMRAYVDQSRRAALVDEAEIALRRMSRELRAAVPNSVKVAAGGQSLQFYNAVAGGRYRAASGPAGGGSDAILEFDRDDTTFDVIGGFGVPAGIYATHRLVVYNLGTPGSDMHEAGSTVISPAGITLGPGERVVMPAHQFGWQSPQQRIYLAEGTVLTYACAGGTLTRNGQVVTANVTGCSFSYNPGSETRSGLVTLNMTLEREAESVTLLRQARLENLP